MKTKKIWSLFIVATLFLSVLLDAPPAFAVEPLGKTITVSYYKRDRETGRDILVDNWDWLDYAAYYRIVPLITGASVLSREKAAELTAPNEFIIILEKDEDGDVITQMSLGNNVNAVTNYTYDHTYFEDINEYGRYFSQALLAEQSNTSPTPPPAIATFSQEGAGVTMYWRTNKVEDVNMIKDALTKSQRITGVDQLRLTNDFNSPDHIRVDLVAPKMPQVVVFDRFQIRATNTSSKTYIYLDTHGMWDEAMGQKALMEKYKSMGIANPPKTY